MGQLQSWRRCAIGGLWVLLLLVVVETKVVAGSSPQHPTSQQKAVLR